MKRPPAVKMAIVGMGCRFPGGADDPDSFWELLAQGDDAISEVPESRWDVSRLFDADRDAPGKMNSRWAGLLRGMSEPWDGSFFGITAAEARALDPHQSLFLEVAWQAFEDALLDPTGLEGSATGVFVGVSSHDFALLSSRIPLQETSAFSIPGACNAVLAGRLSFLLGLRGPSLAIDTASSSSLVALHYASQSLASGECDLAVAGGVNLLLAPETTVGYSKAGTMAPDGRCKVFDEKADGYVRGEGCGVLILKRLEDAVAAGDRVLAVIRGSAVNHDGKSTNLMAPSQLAQEALLRLALSRAEVQPSEVSYLEAHGTGTALGDPVEIAAMATVFGESGSARDSGEAKLFIGSVKANIGHLEAAAGIAGVIKTVMALQRGIIPGQVHLRDLHPEIRKTKLPFFSIPRELTPWPPGASLLHGRIAGVSSFGLAGTNAHVVLEQPPLFTTDVSPDFHERPYHVLFLSAQNEPALLELAGRYETLMATAQPELVGSICNTTHTGRAHLNERLAVSAKSASAFQSKLSALLKGEVLPGVHRGRARKGMVPRTAFLFTGQGSQYAGMGRELHETQPTFRRALERCGKIVDGLLDVPLNDLLFGSHSTRIDQTQYTQPALFALEYALYELWGSWGVAPDAVMGHSVGELVAACVAGVFSLDDGLRMTVHRGRLMQELALSGTMAAVGLSESEVTAALAQMGEPSTLAIAAINGPQSVVISGVTSEVERLCKWFESTPVKVKRLAVSQAFHSPLMEPMLAEFEQVVGQVRFSRPEIPFISNLTGRIVTGDEVSCAGYWRRHAREAVRFSGGLEELFKLDIRDFLEIGPDAVLCGMGRECALAHDRGPEIQWLPSLRKDRGNWEQLTATVGQLYVSGRASNWAGFDEGFPVRERCRLPGYPFQRGTKPVRASRAREVSEFRKTEGESSLFRQEIRKQVLMLLDLDPAHPLSESVPLSEQGVDSLSSIELRVRLKAFFSPDLKIPATLLSDYPSIDALAEYFSRRPEEKPAAAVVFPAMSQMSPDSIAVSDGSKVHGQAVLRSLFEDVWNLGKMGSLLEVIHPEYCAHPILMADWGHGPVSFRNLVNFYLSFLPDLSFQLEEELVDGEKVFGRWSAHGTHEGHFLEFSPTGRKFQFAGTFQAQLREGKIVESWGDWDFRGLLEQLGCNAETMRSRWEARSCPVATRRIGSGNGEPVVLWSTFHVPAWVSWKEHASRLKIKRPVGLFELLANRHSFGRLPPPADYSIQMETQIARAAVLEMGLTSPVHLVAWSAAGKFAIDYALTYPEQVRSLTLIEPLLPWLLQAEGQLQGEYLKFVNAQLEFGSTGTSDAALEKDIRHVQIVPPEVDLCTIPYWKTLVAYREFFAFRRSILQSQKGQATDLQKLRMPILVVTGEQSNPIYRACGELVGKSAPQVQFLRMQGMHGPHRGPGISVFLKHWEEFLAQ